MIKITDLIPIKEQDSIADQDMKQAKAVQRQLQKSMLAIDSAVSEIERRLSSFNSPGLKAAYLDAIKKSFKGNKFDIKSAMKHLDKYYKR
jgi:hypothetical protein